MAYTTYQRNPDGSVTFSGLGSPSVSATGPAAESKAREIDASGGGGAMPPPIQPSPELAAAAAAPSEDTRTANADPFTYSDEGRVKNLLAGGQAQPQAPESVPDTGPLKFSRVLSPAEASKAFKGPEKPAAQGDRDKISSALGQAPQREPGEAAPSAAAGKRVNPGDVVLRPQTEGQGSAMGGGSPIKHSEQRVSRAVERTILPEEDKQHLTEATRLGIDTQSAMTEAEKARAENLATAFHEENGILKQHLDDRAQNEEMRQAKLQEKFADAEKATQELASQSIDSKAFWADKGAGEKAIAAIAIGLGAAGSSLAKGPNVAADLINRAVDQNIDAQKANLEKTRGVAQAKMGLVGQYRELLGDERAAEMETRKTLLDAAMRHIDEVTKDSESSIIQARGEQLKAAIYEKYVGVNAQLDAYKQHEMYKDVTTGGPGAIPFVKDDGTYLDLPGGLSLKASTPDMANQWRQQVDNIEEIHHSTAGVREMLKNPSLVNSQAVKMHLNNIATSLGGAKIGSPRMTGQGELENITHILDAGGTVTSDMWGRVAKALDVVDASASGAMRRIQNSAPRYTRAKPDGRGGLVRFPLPDAPEMQEVRATAVE